MSFEVGDRVRFVRGNDYALSTGGSVRFGDEGVIVSVSPAGAYPYQVKFSQDARPGGAPVNSREIELAEPRKDSPRLGDTVRVVLEGKVTQVNPSGDWVVASRCFNAGTEAVKSVEIIEPARPSVAELPVGSVIRSEGGYIYEKKSRGWEGTGLSGPPFSDEAMDDNGAWTLLVPKESE